MKESIDIAITTGVGEESFELVKVKLANHFVRRGLPFWISLTTIVLCSVFLVGEAELSVGILRDETILFHLGSGSTQQQNNGGGSCFVNMTYRPLETEIMSDIATTPVRAWTSPGGQCKKSGSATIAFEQGPSAKVPDHLQLFFDDNDLIDDSLVSRQSTFVCKTLKDGRYVLRHAILLKPSRDTSLLDGLFLEKDQLYLVLSRSYNLGYCIFNKVSRRTSSPPNDDDDDKDNNKDNGNDNDKDVKDGGLDGGEVAGIVVSGLVTLGAAVIGALALRKWGPMAVEKVKRQLHSGQSNPDEENGNPSHSAQPRHHDRARDHHLYAQQNANGPQNSVSNIINFGSNQNVASHQLEL